MKFVDEILNCNMARYTQILHMVLIDTEKAKIQLCVMTAEVNSKYSTAKQALGSYDNILVQNMVNKDKDYALDTAKRYLVTSRLMSALEMVKDAICKVESNLFDISSDEIPDEAESALTVICCAAKVYSFQGFHNFIRSTLEPVVGEEKIRKFSSPGSLNQQQTNLLYNTTFLPQEATSIIYSAAKHHKIDKKTVDDLFGIQEPQTLYYPSPESI